MRVRIYALKCKKKLRTGNLFLFYLRVKYEHDIFRFREIDPTGMFLVETLLKLYEV